MTIYQKIKSRLGYSLSGWNIKDFKSGIDFAKNNGFKVVEVNLNMPLFFPENINQKDRKEIKSYALMNNIEIALHTPEEVNLLSLQDEIRKAGIIILKKTIDFAKDLGVKRVTTHLGTSLLFSLSKGEKIFLINQYPEVFKRILKDSLTEVVDYAGNKIWLCIENARDFSGAVAKVLDEILKEKNLYLTMDIAHFKCHLEPSKQKETEQFFLHHLDKIKNCHLHGIGQGVYGVYDHALINQGNIDFVYYFNLLAPLDINFIFEIRPEEKAVECLKKFEKYEDILTREVE